MYMHCMVMEAKSQLARLEIMGVLNNKKTFHPLDSMGERARKRKTSSKKLFLNASFLEICYCV